MPEKPNDKTPFGRLRALAGWLKGSSPQPAEPATGSQQQQRGVPDRVGHYAITGKLGAGGMGIVFSALDERLGRTVALKKMSSLGQDESARKRFWREARAAASVNHPNVCQLYEIGEDAGELFIAMELLEGQSLGDRLAGGAMTVAETLPIGLGILAALQALHARNIVHRDLKPSNVFLTPHGVKLLDFGLARPTEIGMARDQPQSELTQTGMVVGTPRYMAPEQVTGEGLDGRTDLFATGAMLFEMLAGRPAFGGRNAVEILHATLYEQPPALTGSAGVVAMDRVIRRALAKKPAERPASAEAMAEDLRAVSGVTGHDAPAVASALTRLVVLPFRILRPDPETDFLAFSLPDAITTSLSGIGSLVVRSSAVAARFKGEAPDLKLVAAEADVDRVVTGTLLRAGDQVRASAQLVEAPGGTLLTSHTVQASLGDLFRLQDDIARRVVEALSLPLTGGAPTPMPEAPHDARAYALYLQANELARSYHEMPKALELYQQCLDLDPTFAPAWARIARCHWLIGKFVSASDRSPERAEAALRRALELNPRLSLAHKIYAHIESDTGHTLAALRRLLAEANRHGNDPELFAGLVHACRYCGLYEQAIAAHEEARRLDPNVPTSLPQTLLMSCDFDGLVRAWQPGKVTHADDVIRVIGLGLAGRYDEATACVPDLRRGALLPAFQTWSDFIVAWIERRPADMYAAISALTPLTIMDDPEAIFQEGWMLCDAGEHARGLGFLRRAVSRGYFVAPTLRAARQFDPLRDDEAFQQLLADAEEGSRRALAAFREGGGERLLGR